MVANIKRMPIGRMQKRCQGHQTMVASHTAVPIGTAKGEMAGMGLPPNNIACPWVGDMCSPCPLPKGKVPGVWCRLPAISQPPRGAAVWLATIV